MKTEGYWHIFLFAHRFVSCIILDVIESGYSAKCKLGVIARPSIFNKKAENRRFQFKFSAMTVAF